MMRIQRPTLVLTPMVALAMLLAGCDAVSVDEPVGEEAVALEVADWQGTWVSGEVVLMTTVLDAAAGRVQAAWMERYEEGARLETSEGVVRRTGDWVFLSMPQPDDAEPDADAAPRPEAAARYLWVRVVNDGRTALLWWPDAEAFRAAVRDGRLPGVIGEDDDIHLGDLTAEHLELINAPESGLLGWQEPMVFVRIGD